MEANKPNLHNTVAGAILPLTQSAITAVLVFLLVLLITVLLDWRKPLVWASTFGLLSWFAAWLLLQTHWLWLTIRVERLLGFDINGDGYTGKPPQPEPTAPPIRIDLVTQSADRKEYNQKRISLHATPNQLKALARGLILDKKSLGEKNWAGSDGIFSLPKFRRLRDEMLAAGLIEEASGKDHRQGYSLTASGRAVMRKILTNQLPLPTATEGVNP